MRKILPLFILVIGSAFFALPAMAIEGFTVGLAIQGCPDQFTFSDTVYELNTGNYAIPTVKMSDIAGSSLLSYLDADPDEARGTYEASPEVIGLGFEVDARYRYEFFMVRLGFKYEWRVSGGDYVITVPTSDNPGPVPFEHQGEPFRIEQTASGSWMIIPLDLCVYVPLFDNKAGIYAGLGPAFFWGQMEVSVIPSAFALDFFSLNFLGQLGNPNSGASAAGIPFSDTRENADKKGTITPSALGIGFEYIMGYEHEIFENFSIFFTIVLNIFAAWDDAVYDGNGQGLGGIDNYNQKNALEYYMIQDFDNMSDDVRSYVDDNYDTHLSFPISGVAWRFGIGAQYKLF